MNRNKPLHNRLWILQDKRTNKPVWIETATLKPFEVNLDDYMIAANWKDFHCAGFYDWHFPDYLEDSGADKDLWKNYQAVEVEINFTGASRELFD